MAKSNKSTMMILFLSLFLLMVGFGIIIPILPFYSRSLGASSFHMGMLMTMYSLIQFIFAPFWGNLSDRVGRKPILTIGLLGFGFTFILFGLAKTLWQLFLFRGLSGLLSSAALPTAMAIVGDITSEEDRGKGMGMIGASMGLGMVLGPAIGGFLSSFGIGVPFFVAGGIAIATVPIILLMLEESLEAEQSVKKRDRVSFIKGLQGPLALIMMISLLVSFTNANLETTIAYFGEDQFGFGSYEMGIAFSVMGLFMVITQGVFVGNAINKYGEYNLIKAGLIIIVIGFMLLSFAQGLVSLSIYLSFSGIGFALLRPSLSSLVSKKTEIGQGASLGLLSSFDSLGRILGPLWGGWIYLFNHKWPFFSSAALVILILIGLMVTNIEVKTEKMNG